MGQAKVVFVLAIVGVLSTTSILAAPPTYASSTTRRATAGGEGYGYGGTSTGGNPYFIPYGPGFDYATHAYNMFRSNFPNYMNAGIATGMGFVPPGFMANDLGFRGGGGYGGSGYYPGYGPFPSYMPGGTGGPDLRMGGPPGPGLRTRILPGGASVTTSDDGNFASVHVESPPGGQPGLRSQTVRTPGSYGTAFAYNN